MEENMREKQDKEGVGSPPRPSRAGASGVSSMITRETGCLAGSPGSSLGSCTPGTSFGRMKADDSESSEEEVEVEVFGTITTSGGGAVSLEMPARSADEA